MRRDLNASRVCDTQLHGCGIRRRSDGSLQDFPTIAEFRAEMMEPCQLRRRSGLTGTGPCLSPLRFISGPQSGSDV
jgi:hypothetical protein